MITETATRRDEIVRRIEQLVSIPSMEAIVQPLVNYLQQPLETLEVQRVVDLVSHDSSLAAQCLHMANSPLFGRWQTITTTRGAVIALGLQRMRDIVVSCCMLNMFPAGQEHDSPAVFWEHSLACALVARRIAKRIGMKDPEQAYMSGLMHDLGFVVHLHVAPKEFRDAVHKAEACGYSIEKAEEEVLGLTHCDSGQMLAEKWELAPFLVDVIRFHHRSSQTSEYLPLVAIINLSDRLCRIQGLGHGFREGLRVHWEKDEAIEILNEAYPVARSVNWQRFSAEFESYLKDVQKLVSVLYRLN